MYVCAYCYGRDTNHSFPHSYHSLLPPKNHFPPQALPEFVATPNYFIASFSRLLLYFLD